MSLHLDDDYDDPTPRQTELTLTSGVILGVCLALFLLCALFFWFGYSMRGGSRAATLPTAQIAEPTSPDATFNSFKPAAGSPVSSGTSAATSPTPVPSPATKPLSTPQSTTVAASRPAQPVATTVPALATTQTASGFYVQVAAVSHQPDADKLVSSLHAEGYLATARSAPQDTLFHVQIGPYASRRDADLIRQKLAAEGYTPIVK